MDISLHIPGHKVVFDISLDYRGAWSIWHWTVKRCVMDLLTLGCETLCHGFTDTCIERGVYHLPSSDAFINNNANKIWKQCWNDSASASSDHFNQICFANWEKTHDVAVLLSCTISPDLHPASISRTQLNHAWPILDLHNKQLPAPWQGCPCKQTRHPTTASTQSNLVPQNLYMYSFKNQHRLCEGCYTFSWAGPNRSPDVLDDLSLEFAETCTLALQVSLQTWEGKQSIIESLPEGIGCS